MFLKYNLFTLLWASLIAIATLLPGKQIPQINYSDKLVHMMIFAVLTLLMIVGFIKQNTFAFLRFNAVKVALVISICYGAGLEAAQQLIPGRHFDWFDFAANVTGTLLGWLFFYV
ncbi:MAG: VanZ family protein, partial [Bacteroidota bacterium]